MLYESIFMHKEHDAATDGFLASWDGQSHLRDRGAYPASPSRDASGRCGQVLSCQFLAWL